MRKRTSRLKLILKTLLQKGQEGVTLIELLVVIVILAIIAAVAVPIVTNSVSSAKVSTTKQNMAIVVDALNRYATDHDGKYPTSNLTPLTQATNETGGTPAATGDTSFGPYLGSVPKDGYGGNFTYTGNTTDGSTFTLTDSKSSLTASNTNETPG